MVDRSAVSTITGYFYQFDLSILSLLELAQDDDRVEVECIEDIDVHTASESTAIQCKYYEKSEYNHSVIKPAIMHMLAHYKEGLTAGRRSIKYTLKGYFGSGQDKFPVKFDVQFLKDHFLTYVSKEVTHRKYEELDVSDDELNSFLSVLTVDVHSRRFDDQFNAIVKKLTELFECTSFAAEFFFYNNALRVIKELSIKSDATERTITKREFLRRIDTSTILFDEWFIAKRGKTKYLAELRSQYFTSLNLSPAERLFIVHVDPVSYSRSRLKSLLQQISRKYSKISKRDKKPFSPYVLLIGVEDTEQVSLKQELHNENFKFVDGHDFKGSDFDPTSISRPADYERGPILRIFNSVDNAQQTFRSFEKKREVYEFYRETPIWVFADKAVSYLNLQIPDYEDIRNII